MAVWPPELHAVVERSVATEYGTLTASGRPVTVPVSAYPGKERRTVEVQTGLTFPAKADRARRNPKVCLLFADPIGEAASELPVVLVQGHAAVRDADLQGNTDRYVALSASKYPEAAKAAPRFVQARMAFYFARIFIEVTPLRIRWWPSRDLDIAPSEWRANDGVELPESDPAPTGAPPGPWRRPPVDWRPAARVALDRLELTDLSTVDADGYPMCVPVRLGPLRGDTIDVTLGPGTPNLAPGPACLTLHSHDKVFTGEENLTLVGRFHTDVQGSAFQVERALGDWSTAGTKLHVALSFLAKAPRLAPRLKAEAARRGQAVPKVRFPSN